MNEVMPATLLHSAIRPSHTRTLSIAKEAPSVVVLRTQESNGINALSLVVMGLTPEQSNQCKGMVILLTSFST